jgi:hypothetical protein
MSWQLIYTSAPRGLTPGQSGYCTVARSRDLREALIPRLEKFSYYTPEPNRNPVICAHRIVELRGVRYHVLTRIVDAGLDFTKRRKFIAHHLVFGPAELANVPFPASIFLKWKGWLEHWEGDPQWLSDPAFFPEPKPSGEIEATNAWITGDARDRENFLYSLQGCSWDVTFTNCFQPGDHPADFRLRAIWPNTAGFEAAAKAGAEPIRLRDLKTAPTRETPVPTAEPIPRAAPVPVAETRKRKPKLLWPWLAGAATLIALGIAIFFRNHPTVRIETPAPEIVQNTTPPPARASVAPASPPLANIDNIFTSAPTWLALAEDGHLGPAPEIERLFQSLRDAELFGKDIKATLQNAGSEKKEDATVDAQPHDGKIIFKIPKIQVELTSEKGALTLAANARAPLILEINSRERILIIPKGAPLGFPKAKLIIDSKSQIVSMDSNLEERLQNVVLPRGAQLALRPQKTSLEAQESIFGLSPATTFDLAAIRKQVDHVLKEKAKSVEALRHELEGLKAHEKKLLTDAKTPEEIKRKEELATLKAAFPKAQQELRALRERAATIPDNLSKIDVYSLFLCQNSVNTEIIRFEDAAP